MEDCRGRTGLARLLQTTEAVSRARDHWLWPFKAVHRATQPKDWQRLRSMSPPNSLPVCSSICSACSCCLWRKHQVSEVPWPLELIIAEHLSPEGCCSSSLICPPDGLTAVHLPAPLPCILLALHTLDGLCWLPCSTMIMLALPSAALAEPPAKMYHRSETLMLP